MLDWYEKQIERWTQRVHYGLISRLHPDLNRISDEKNRMWAMWFAAAGPTGWGRYVGFFTMLVAGPVAVIIVTRTVAHSFGWGYRMQSPWLIVGGWVAGFVATAVAIELSRRRHVRTRYFLAMRILGHDVCPDCGYDMGGHLPRTAPQRTCPECGGTVPAFRSHVESAPMPTAGDRAAPTVASKSRAA